MNYYPSTFQLKSKYNNKNNLNFLIGMKSQTQDTDLQCQRMLYATPPNIQDCYRHRKANIIFKNISSVELSQSLFNNHCQCCGRIVGKQPKHRFKYDPMEASYLGSGIPLFFAFFRCVLYTLLVHLIGFGIYTTATNVNIVIKGSNCVSSCGRENFWNKISVFNIFDQYLTIQVQTYFELVIIIITLLANLSIRSYINYLQIYIDEFFAKPSDYSLILRKVPEKAERQDIEQMIEKRRQSLTPEQMFKTDKLKITDILMVRDLTEYLEIQKKNLQAIKSLIAEKQKDKQNNKTIDDVYFQNPVVPNKFAKTAIVIFSRAQSKQFFLHNSSCLQKFINILWGSYYPRSNIHQVKQTYISIQRAPEPDDLIWKNCGKTTKQLLLKRLFLSILSFAVLGLGGGVQYLIQYIRNKYVSLQQPFVQFLFSLGAAGSITLFNFLISQIFEFMARHEGHDTKTQQTVAMTFRIVVLQFLNSGIFLVLTNIFVKITTDQRTYDYRKTVLSSNIVQLMTMNAISGNLTTFFFNKFQIFKLYGRSRILKSTKLFPQIEANIYFQPHSISLHLKYAYIFKTFWLTVFFMPTVPLVIAISSVGLLINYWTQKYLFSGSYLAPEAISSYLSNHVLNLLDFTPLWLTFGSFFIHFVRKNFIFSQIENQIKNFHYLFLLLSVLNIFLPYSAILKKLHIFRQTKYNDTTYQESECTFELTYKDTNPTYLNHHKKRVREEQIFKQKFVQQPDFKEMRKRLSHSQVLINYKESLLNKSSLLGASDYTLMTTRHRASSVNF